MTVPPPAEIRRIVYFGSPETAVPPLLALYEAGYEIPLVVTRPDRRRGRGTDEGPTSVKAAAARLGLAVTDDLEAVGSARADLGVVVAYGEIIGDRLLDRLAIVNVHFSLLPRWRGPAPVERAILAGDPETGVCLMELASEIDTGAVYRRASTPIGPGETAGELRARLVDLGVELLTEALASGFGSPTPQAGEATHASKISTAELKIDWTEPAERIQRLIRVGGAWTMFRGRRLKIHAARLVPPGEPVSPGIMAGTRVATGAGWVELVTVQPEGKLLRSGTEWLNGVRPSGGERLGS